MFNFYRPENDIELEERFIGDLKNAKQRKLFAPEKLLIFSSLVNSSKYLRST